MTRREQIEQIIEDELSKPDSLAEQLRTAAWYVLEIFPDCTSKEFADAAVANGLHYQASRNRFNEGKKNLISCS